MTFPYLRSSEQVVLTSFTSEHSTIPFDSGNSSPANQLYLSRRNSGTSAFGFPHRNRPCIISRACWFSVYSFLNDANVPRRAKSSLSRSTCTGQPAIRRFSKRLPIERIVGSSSSRRCFDVTRATIRSAVTISRMFSPSIVAVTDELKVSSFGLRLEPPTEYAALYEMISFSRKFSARDDSKPPVVGSVLPA